MSGTKCAWAVVVAHDDDVTGAIMTGMMLRKAQTTGTILAILSNHVSKLFVSSLDGIFDMVIAKDIAGANRNGDSEDVVNFLLQSISDLRSFEKVVALRPGVAILRQSDNLFDCDMESGEDQVMLNESENWVLVVINTSFNNMDMGNGHRIPTICDINDTLLDNTKQPDIDIAWVDQEFWDTILSQISPANTSQFSLTSYSTESSNWIAIVGMSCRFPGANSIEEYWDLLNSGRDTSSGPPENRISLVDIDKNIKANFLKCPIDQFDASFFGISPSEAAFVDPQARLLLEVSWEAFENAGIVPEKLKGSSTGVFCGAWLQEYMTAMNAQDSDPSEEFLRKYLGNGFGCTAAKLSFFYGFTGPNISTESGCSSSMVAVDLACKSLQRRECPVALTAGANIILQINMKKKVVWAEDGRSKTFDAAADGYARAEGIAVLVMKRYSDAIRDGDRIHGIIRGAAASQEGLSKSFGTPTLESECKAMRGALRAARVDPSQVDYVEAHATGTAVGDPIEAAAIVKAYSTKIQRHSSLLIGSGKTNIGHTESCAGLAGMIKVLLAMKHEVIPAHINLTSVNPYVNFDPIPGEIPIRARPWPRSNSRARIAGVSSFGITGTDVHLILQEPPPTKQLIAPPQQSRNLQIMTISAKSLPALLQLCEKYANHLHGIAEDEQNKFSDFVYSVNTTRTHHYQSRKALLISGPSQAARLLRKLISTYNFSHATSIKSKSSKSDKLANICFAFPGITGNMDFHPAKQLYKFSSEFKLHFDHCSVTWRILYPEKKRLVDVLLAKSERDGIIKPVSFYACYLAIQYSIVMIWKCWGVHPGMVLGHCLGELTACLVSGVLSLENAFKMVSYMELFTYNDKVPPGSMLAMNCDEATAQNLINQFLNTEEIIGDSDAWIDIAGINTPTQTVVAAPTNVLECFQQFCENVRSKLLSVDFAVHSRAIQVTWEIGKKMLGELETSSPKIPYISSVTGKLVQDGDVTPEFLFGVFRDTVQFTKSCQVVMNPGENLVAPDAIVEVGLGTTLAALVQENLVDISVEGHPSPVILSSFQRRKGKDFLATDEEGFSGLLATLAEIYMGGGYINWEGFYKFDEGHRSKVDLPHYPFQKKSFWFGKKSRRNTIYDNGELVDTEQIHPLLGGNFPTALETNRIYQNWMRESKAPYIYDHVIGSHVIFPGAGHLEIMLSACRLEKSLPRSSHHLVIDDFAIHKPLYLSRTEARRLQCILDTTTKRVTIYASLTGENATGHPWSQFASGMVSISDSEPFKKVQVSSIINNYVASEQVAQKFYSNAAEVGLNFGPAFKSLKRVFQTQDNETLIEIALGEEAVENYVAHPILLDAMIQGFILHSKPHFSKLHVPVKIGKLLWLGSEDHDELSRKFYVFCKSESTGITNNVYLLNEHGSILCVMMHLELAPTTVHSVLHAAGVPSEDLSSGAMQSLPSIYEVDWQQSKSLQMKDALGISGIKNMTGSTDFQNAKMLLEQKSHWTEVEEKLDASVNKLCYLYVLKALYDLGWVPEVGMGLPDFSSLVVSGLRPALHHYLTFLVEESILESDTFVQKNIPLTQCQVNEAINRLIENELRDCPAIDIIHACGSQLAAILQGQVTGQYILFGSEKNGNTYAELFYKLTRFNYGMFQAPAKVFMSIAGILSVEIIKTKCLRILEVGSGTGSFTSQVLDNMTELGINFQYVFTDISSSFFSRAQNKFSTHVTSGQMEFKVLDIEKDPLEQGFPPNYFDVVVGVDVFHATRHLKRTMGNVRKVVRKGGMLVIGETDKPVRELDICFGILDGYWLYEDLDLRSRHCTLNAGGWRKILEEVGFDKEELCDMYASGGQMSVITARYTGSGNDMVADAEGKEWVVFHTDYDHQRYRGLERKLHGLGRQISYLNVGEMDIDFQRSVRAFLEERRDRLEGILFWINGESCELSQPKSREALEPLLWLAKFIGECRWKRLPKLHVITRGVWTLSEAGDRGDVDGDVDNHNCDASLLWGFMRTFRVELPQLESKCIALDENANEDEQLDWVLNEMWVGDDKETEIVFRQGSRLVRRLRMQVEVRKTNTLDIPSNCYTILLPSSKVMGDLKYIPKGLPSSGGGLHDNQVEIRVRSASLNFRDVMCVMKPIEYFESATTIGLDFSGVISAVGGNISSWKVGDPVFGCNWTEGTITSHLVTDADLIMGIPENLTFNEAATLPAVFLTAWHCMVNVAQMKTGQSILIHAASGGVGLIAIQLAKYLGLKVFGTAGSTRKRNFVRSLGVQHVFNSRSLEFGEKIKDITGGKGVDMILNCLTGPGFKETSLDCCKAGGYFVEISKLDIWSVEQVKEKRADVQYHIVDATVLERNVLSDIFLQLPAMLKDGSVRPLYYTSYPAGNIVDALIFLQKAKQIGKVIVEMPEVDTQTGEVEQRLFNERSSYLITGGLGAIGLSVARWMVRNGAKCLILVGRSPPNDKAKQVISDMMEETANVVVITQQCDISKLDQCKWLFENLRKDDKVPPVRGIHHCSGVLSDKLIMNQDWSTFEAVLAPKVDGAYNLHHATIELQLEFFVVYSSMSSTFGNAGQSNYAAANCYMDALVETRGQMGLPGLSVNWGQWDAGLAENLKLDWTEVFSITQGIKTLDKLMRENRSSAVVGNLKFPGVLSLYRKYEDTLFENLVLSEIGIKSSEVKGHKSEKVERGPTLIEMFMKRKEEEGFTLQEKSELIRNCVSRIICDLLGVSFEDVEPDVQFSDMGMDSLMSIEFTNMLQVEMGDIKLGFVDMDAHGSVNGMTSLVMSIFDE